MKTTSFGRLLGSTSLVVLSAAAVLGTQQPAAAQTTISNSLYGGGSTLSSLTLRQLFDCYAGTTVANDGQSFSPTFTFAPPSPDMLPAACTQFSTAVEGLFAAVGAGNGQRAYIADDARQLFRGSPDSAPALVRKPSAKPPFRDTANANFKTYPYPRLDFATSDLPLAGSVASLTTVSFSNFLPTTNWQNTLLIAVQSSTAVSFNAAAVGAPIQIPAVEIPVAIAVNTSNSASGVTWTNQSALSPNTQAGGAIQLSTAQLCAIFSATVTDWHDTSTLIPYLDANGTQQFQHFYDDNTNGTLTPVAYTSARLPIKVVYRADDAGASYILTNYLANLCPLLDPTGTYNYKKIFTGVGAGGSTTANLPSSKFHNLVDNILAVKGATDHEHHDPYDVDDDEARPDPRWITAMGSNHEALKVGTDSSRAGRIGYVSTDFTQPYAQSATEEISGSVTTATAPLSASIQNEALRIFGVYHPGQSGSIGTPTNFVPPTPDNVAQAFSGLSAPSASGGYNAWNIYGQSYAAGTVLGGVDYSGRSVIGIPLVSLTDYALTGASYANVYSCYADAGGTRVPTLKNWLAWLYGGSVIALPRYNPATSTANNPGYDPDVAQVVRNNGFHELDATWASNVLNGYLLASSAGGLPKAIAAYNASGTQVDGCQGVTGGAK